MALLSVILPSYNEEEILSLTARRLGEVLSKEDIAYQLVFVDDGSDDGTWDRIREAADADPGITGIRFSRNFGKEAAIFAGLAWSRGDCAAVMDCDLQHPPETLVKMYRLWEEGYEVIEGVKKSRGSESRIHSLSARAFNRIMSGATHIDMSAASDFKLLDRRAVDVLLHMPERNTFFRAMSCWIGFKTATVQFDVMEREAGSSKWSTRSLVHYAITNIAAYSSLPMQMVTGAGVFSLLLSLILGIHTIAKYLSGHAVEGFTTVILLILLLGSIVMISLGIIGYYISQIYEEVKARPRYIVSQTIADRPPARSGKSQNLKKKI